MRFVDGLREPLSQGAIYLEALRIRHGKNKKGIRINNMKSKAERKEYQRIYHLNHREKEQIRNKAYRLAHQKEIRAYRLAHQEEAKIRRKAYRLTHRDETSARDRAYCLAHREEISARNKAYRLAHREEKKAYHLTQYGLTQASFERLITAQGGACAICGRSDWNGRGPHVDHDHNTGKVRAILCHNCNAALGLLREDLNILKRMGDYISKFKEMTA